MRAIILASGLLLGLQWSTGPMSLPTGALILMSSGTSCPLGSLEATDLSGKMLLTTTIAAANVGGTGGSDNVTPAGTNTAPAFTGSQASLTHANTAVTSHSYTPAGTVAAPVFTGTPFSSVINHTHVITSTLSIQGGVTSIVTGTHVMASTAVGGSIRAVTAGDGIVSTEANPAGGVASITPAGTNAVPAFTGTLATLTHTVTQPDAHSYTPAGTVAAPTFTGASLDNRSAFIRVIVCRAR